jgi:hypothetical protein
MNLILPSQQPNDAINFSAFVPVGSSDLGGDSTYQINTATVAPIPITFWHFSSAIGHTVASIFYRTGHCSKEHLMSKARFDGHTGGPASRPIGGKTG